LIYDLEKRPEMQKLKVAITTLGILILSLPAGTQTVLSLEEAVAIALANNYNILLAKNDSTASALDMDYTYAAFLPRINATINNIWNSNNQHQRFADGNTREASGVRSYNLNGNMALNWTIFDGMKMFTTKEKIEEIWRLGEINIKNQVVNTFALVTQQYFNIVRQKQQLRAIEEQISVSEERVKVAERKLSTGLGSKPELLQARVDLNAQKARQLQQQTLIAQLKEQLNQTTGKRLPESFDVADEIPINTGLTLESLRNNISQTNPSILLAERNIGIARLTLRERRAERWPTVSFNSAYNYSRLDNQKTVNPFQPLLSQSNGFNIGLTANIPILNNKLVMRNIQQTELDIQYLSLVYENNRIQIDAAVNNSFRDYQYQMQALSLEEENIELAKENVTIALERFRQGVSTYLELREAQKSLEDAYNRLIAARYNAKLAETELLRLRGEIVR
jgi:outer membrane protein TolC